MMGWTNNFSYKGFNLSFLIDFRIGGSIYSATAPTCIPGVTPPEQW